MHIMIELVELSKLNNKTAYSINTYIPRSEKFSFSISDNKIDFYENIQVFEHLKKIYAYTDYLIHVYYNKPQI